MERYRTTLLLGAVLLVLGGLAFFLSSRSATSPGTETPTPNVYIWEDENPVKGLEVMSGSDKIVLIKDVVLGSWRITEPVDQPADLFQVGGVADSFQRLLAQYTLSDTTDLEQYGLAGQPLMVTSTFSDTAGTKRTLLVGKVTPDGTGYYVKLPDSNKLYTVGNFTVEPLRTWLTTPPVQPPTPTLVPITPVTATPTETPSPTVQVAGTSAAPTATVTVGATSPVAASTGTPASSATP
jgi:hypothetical protein